MLRAPSFPSHTIPHYTIFKAVIDYMIDDIGIICVSFLLIIVIQPWLSHDFHLIGRNQSMMNITDFIEDNVCTMFGTSFDHVWTNVLGFEFWSSVWILDVCIILDHYQRSRRNVFLQHSFTYSFHLIDVCLLSLLCSIDNGQMNKRGNSILVLTPCLFMLYVWLCYIALGVVREFIHDTIEHKHERSCTCQR